MKKKIQSPKLWRERGIEQELNVSLLYNKNEIVQRYQELDELDFVVKKRNSEQIINLYTPFASPNKLESMMNCGSFLQFGLYRHEQTSEEKKKLHKAGFCKDKFCPMCNWRRARKYAIQNYKILKALEQKSKVRYIFATFTVKNPKLEDLRSSITAMNKAFLKMMRRKRVKDSVMGYIKAIEFPFQKGSKEYINLHIHTLLVVPAKYFDTKYNLYIKQNEWQELWRDVLGVDYDPSVDIRIIRPKKDGDDPIASVVAETTKYPMKDMDLSKLQKDNDWEIFKELVDQTRGLRLVSYGGILKKVRKILFGDEDIDDDLVYRVDDDLDDKWKLIALLMYEYDGVQYKLMRNGIKEPPKDDEKRDCQIVKQKCQISLRKRQSGQPIPIQLLDKDGKVKRVIYDHSQISDWHIFMRTMRKSISPPPMRYNVD